ncbi:uncharacterized protein LOC143851312 [Tasmannia lanceolata]|uniref:uncharacterized protein LOC143851312 n=1 Tax=Tasmannia lanceolata TaxID=3420 RepID=UPI0040632505
MVYKITFKVKPPKNAEGETKSSIAQENSEFENMRCNGSKKASHGIQKPPRRSPPIAIGLAHKVGIQSVSCDLQSKAFVSSDPGVTKIDLSKLQTDSLKRYCRNFNLAISPDPSREQLIYAVERHLELQQLDEFQVIKEFVYAAKRMKSLSQLTLNWHCIQC